VKCLMCKGKGYIEYDLDDRESCECQWKYLLDDRKMSVLTFKEESNA